MSATRSPEPRTLAVSLAAKVAFLSRPESYSPRTERVDVIETHVSWVFLTDQRAYKLKKPVRLDYLDFTTLEARHADCCDEVRLNRRLAPAVYLGVTPLRLGPAGLRLNGTGVTVDWLVEMRRLAADRMLDRALLTGAVVGADVDRVATRLSRFYEATERVVMTPHEYRQRIERAVREDRGWLRVGAFGLDSKRVDRPAAIVLEVLQRNPALVEQRACRLVEGHGDLRPEHVGLVDDEPVIIDCLEFCRDFRITDPVDELAFLGLECERLGADWIGPRLLARYGEDTGDRPPSATVELYAACRALLRAKLCVWHLRDAEVRSTTAWPAAALGYLALAADRCDRLQTAIGLNA